MESILRKCVHCGFCLSDCPTYNILGDERDSPRGRIYLIKELIESNGKSAPFILPHVDKCLSCLACVSVCPSGVDYQHYIDFARFWSKCNALYPPKGATSLRGMALLYDTRLLTCTDIVHCKV